MMNKYLVLVMLTTALLIIAGCQKAEVAPPPAVTPPAPEPQAPEPTAPVAAATGGIFAISSPSGADFYVDDIFRGRTPLAISGISAGTRNIRFTKEGFQAYVDVVNVEPDKTAEMQVVLKAK